MAQHKLSFEVERACRCSFVVRFENGEQAFISNHNLLTLMRDPNTPFNIIERMDSRTRMIRKWIVVLESNWTLGFKKPMFGPDGRKL